MSEEPVRIRVALKDDAEVPVGERPILVSSDDLSRDPSDDALYRDGQYLDGPLPSSRVPHIGHAAMFLSFAGLMLLLSQLVMLTLSHTATSSAGVVHPKRQLAAMAVTYFVTLGACFLVFPLFWGREFPAGLNWNGGAARRLAARLVAIGLLVGWGVQAMSSLIPMPKSIPMDDFFKTPSDVWLVTLFGTLLAPLFEEIAFRGFLLPAFSIAFDWLAPVVRYVAAFSSATLGGQEPPRHVAIFREAAPAGLAPDTGNLFFRSRTAVVSASLVTSALFALLHAEQLAHAWAALAILFGVSLVLTAVRVRTRSVACSTSVHASYNLSVFLTLLLATGGYRHLDKIGK
jgi:membrane protease YdiL (CAAX protease family)